MVVRSAYLNVVIVAACVALAGVACSPTGQTQIGPSDRSNANDQTNANDQANANESPNTNTNDSPDVPIERSDVDVHAHLDWFYPTGGQGAGWTEDTDAAVATALGVMDAAGVEVALLMPPPFTRAKLAEPIAYDYTDLAAVASDHSDRFAFIGGGATLNPIIEETAPADVTQAIRDNFTAKAVAIVDAGAVGFGEFAALHLSFFDDHPFIELSPDHPLFLLLADIAATHGLPIDLHMEAVAVDDTPLNSEFSEANPPTVDENMTAFAALLSHNREAKIVWTHVGWDNTGAMTVELLRSLMEAHSNLYLCIKVLGGVGRQAEANRPVDPQGTIRDDWIDLIRDFDDRVLLGADEFYGIAGLTPERPKSTQATWDFVNQLPDDLAAKVAGQNARRIFNLPD